LREALCAQVKHPAELAEQDSHFDPDSESFSVVEFEDGRLFERQACPQRVNGRSVGRVIVYRDVTNRVQSARNMTFSQAVHESSGPILCVDHQSRGTTYGNPAALELLGYSADEIVGMNIAQLDACYTVDRAKELDRKLRSPGKLTGFGGMMFRRKDGSLRNIDAIVSSTVNADRRISVFSFRDTTEQETAAQESKEQQVYLNALMNSIPDIVSFRDAHGVYRGWNDALVALRGHTAAEAIGCTAYDLFDQQSPDRVAATDRQLMATLEPSFNEELVVYPDGSEKYFDMVRSPLRDERGKVL